MGAGASHATSTLSVATQAALEQLPDTVKSELKAVVEKAGIGSATAAPPPPPFFPVAPEDGEQAETCSDMDDD